MPQVLIGNREWMKTNNVRVSAEMEQSLQRHEELGQTVVLAAVDGTLGILTFSKIIHNVGVRSKCRQSPSYKPVLEVTHLLSSQSIQHNCTCVLYSVLSNGT